MNVIDIKHIPLGAAVEIILADFLPVRQNETETAFKYLCLDEQERLVTSEGTSRLVGGASVPDLEESLKRLGYVPFSSD